MSVVRVIVSILQILQSYFNFILAMIDVQSIFFAMLYTALLFDNFRLTEMLYVFMIEEGFNRSAAHLDKCVELVKTSITTNQS